MTSSAKRAETVAGPPPISIPTSTVSSTAFFKALRLLDCPRLVGLVYNVVGVCLKEGRILG